MGNIDDINKLDPSVKIIVLAYLFIMPIWYVDIFLFHKVFFYGNPIYIPIVFSFVLTTCWFFVNFSIILFLKSGTKGIGINDILSDAIFSSFGILSSLSFCEYWLRQFKIFGSFVTFGFIYLGIISMFVIIFRWKKKRKNHKDHHSNNMNPDNSN